MHRPVARLGRKTTAALGLLLGAGPAALAGFVPQAAELGQLGQVLLGAMIGMRAAGRHGRCAAEMDGRRGEASAV
jgi:hypothetical protein